MRKKTQAQQKPKTKLEHAFLLQKTKEIQKDWMATGINNNKKYFGYLNKKTMSFILIIMLILIIIGDVLLVTHLFFR